MKANWQTKKLGEVCDIYQPKTISKKEMIKNGKYPVFGENGIIGKYNKFNHENSELLITCRGATCGSVNISIPKSWINGNAMVVRPKDKMILSEEFLKYFFIGIDLSSVITGSAQPQITRQTLAPFQIPLPPIPEQKRIVGILDEVFEDVKKAKENTEKNLANAKELFESVLEDTFKNDKLKIINDKWEGKKLEKICEVIAGQSPEGKYYNKTGNGLPFYQGKKEFTNKFIGEPKNWTTKITKEALKDDILMSVRAPVGPINFATQKICIGRGLAAIRRGKKIDVDFLFYFLRNFESKIIGNHGAVFNSINKKQIENIQIPLPLLSEQKQIVKKLDELSAETKKLEKIYQQKIDDLEELKKSVLKKAFLNKL